VRIFGANATAWSALRKLGNSPLAKATIAVPILAHLLILNASVLEWLEAADYSTRCEAAYSSDAVPVPLLYTGAWRLVFLYYGLTFTGIATAIFGFFCPFSHKKYGDAIDYAINVKQLFPTEESRATVRQTLDAFRRRRFFGWFCPRDVQGDLEIRWSDLSKEGGKFDEGLLVSSLRTQYRVVDFAKPPVRVLVFAFYAAGLVIVGLAAAWGMLEVAAALFAKELIASPWCWML
jgi:hypothetical protein